MLQHYNIGIGEHWVHTSITECLQHVLKKDEGNVVFTIRGHRIIKVTAGIKQLKSLGYTVV